MFLRKLLTKSVGSVVSKVFDSPVKTAMLIAFIAFVFIVLITGFWDFVSATVFPNTRIGLYEKGFWENILVEAHGIVIELVFVGILVIWLDSRRSKNSEILRLNEDLVDYAQLDFPEINVKKLGHIKRLNAAGVMQINVQNLALNRLDVRDVFMRDSKTIGLKVSNGTISNSTFVNVKMRSSNFEKTTIKGSKFENCSLLKSKFSNAICKGVSFSNSILERADFINANLQSSNFSNCDMGGVKLAGANLNHCSFQGATNLDAIEIAKASSIDYIAISNELLEELKVLRPDMKYQSRNGRALRN